MKRGGRRVPERKRRTEVKSTTSKKWGDQRKSKRRRNIKR